MNSGGGGGGGGGGGSGSGGGGASAVTAGRVSHIDPLPGIDAGGGAVSTGGEPRRAEGAGVLSTGAR
jgi:hypothetical protein